MSERQNTQRSQVLKKLGNIGMDIADLGLGAIDNLLGATVYRGVRRRTQEEFWRNERVNNWVKEAEEMKRQQLNMRLRATGQYEYLSLRPFSDNSTHISEPQSETV